MLIDVTAGQSRWKGDRKVAWQKRTWTFSPASGTLYGKSAEVLDSFEQYDGIRHYAYHSRTIRLSGKVCVLA